MFEHKSAVDFSSKEKSSFIAQFQSWKLIWKVTLTVLTYVSKYIKIKSEFKKETEMAHYLCVEDLLEKPRSHLKVFQLQ